METGWLPGHSTLPPSRDGPGAPCVLCISPLRGGDTMLQTGKDLLAAMKNTYSLSHFPRLLGEELYVPDGV